jgi:hypothetical protein
MQTHEDVPYRVYNLEEHIFDAWTRTNGLETMGFKSSTGFIHPDRLIKMRSQVLTRPLITPDAMVQCGYAIARQDHEDRRPYQMLPKSPKKKSKSDQKAHSKETASHSKAVQWAKSGAGAEKIQEVRKELAAALRKLEDVPDHQSAILPVIKTVHPNSRLLSSSLLSRVRIGSSCSTKLNYILNEVRSCGRRSW